MEMIGVGYKETFPYFGVELFWLGNDDDLSLFLAVRYVWCFGVAGTEDWVRYSSTVC